VIDALPQLLERVILTKLGILAVDFVNYKWHLNSVTDLEVT